MKYPFLALGMIMVGMSGLIFINMFQSITVNNESEYYVLKEAMKASMLESIDLSCYRSNENEGCGGVVKISEQKFVENFTRRFTKSINGNVESYKLEFYDIIESPPKVSVIVRGNGNEYKFHTGQSISNDIANTLTGILETSDYSVKENSSTVSGNVDLPSSDLNSMQPSFSYDDIYVDDQGQVSSNCSIEVNGVLVDSDCGNEDVGEDFNLDSEYDDEKDVE